MRIKLVNEKIPYTQYPNFRIYNIAYGDSNDDDDDENDAITTSYQAIVDNNRLVSIVRGHYQPIPHQLVYDTAMSIAKEKNFIKVDRFTAYAPKYERFVITLLDPKNYFKFNGDRYMLGVTLCNSYDYSMSLMASLYLHRDKHNDGLFMPIDLDLKVKHFGNVDRLITTFSEGIDQLFNKKDIVVTFLQKMKEMILTPELVVKLIKLNMPLRVLTQFAIIQGNKEDEIIVKKGTNMLDVLNEYANQFTNMQRMNSAIAYRIQRPIIKSLMKELGNR